MFTKLGLFLARRQKVILLAFLAVLAVGAWYGIGVFGSLSSENSSFSDPRSESAKARQAIQDNFSDGDLPLTVLFRTNDSKTIDDPVITNEVKNLIKSIPSATVTSYFSTGLGTFVSTDRKQTFANVVPNEVDAEELVGTIRKNLKSDLVTVTVGGQAAITKDINAQVEEDLKIAEIVSFSILAVLLVLVFRSFVAASLPLLLGGVTIIGAFAVTRLLTGFIDISNYAINVITLIGLGLAVDYALFMVNRFREELNKQSDVNAAIVTTVSTAGRTIFFSGLTIMLSLLGLMVFPLNFLQSMSIGGASAVLIAMLLALIIMPALLGVIGFKINSLSFGSVRRARLAQKTGIKLEESQSIWYKIGLIVTRWPWASVVVALFVLLTAGLPFLHARFGAPDYRTLPEGSESRLVSEALVNNFDIDASPISIVFTANGDIKQPANLTKLYDYTQKLQKITGVKTVTSIVSLKPELSLETYKAIYSQPQQPQIII